MRGSLVVTETLSVQQGNRGLGQEGQEAQAHGHAGQRHPTIKPGGQTQIKVALNRAGKKLLTARHTLNVDLSVTEGRKSLATKKFSFKAPKKKRKGDATRRPLAVLVMTVTAASRRVRGVQQSSPSIRQRTPAWRRLSDGTVNARPTPGSQ
jgi:hypothetical protein